jgi:hypothetical protein
MKTSKAGIFIVTALSALSLSSARADQPHMRSALEHLRAARTELQEAEHNKGGWRARALMHTDRAIGETERAMAVAR